MLRFVEFDRKQRVVEIGVGDGVNLNRHLFSLYHPGVTAVANGPIGPNLLGSFLIRQHWTDGFRYMQRAPNGFAYYLALAQFPMKPDLDKMIMELLQGVNPVTKRRLNLKKPPKPGPLNPYTNFGF